MKKHLDADAHATVASALNHVREAHGAPAAAPGSALPGPGDLDLLARASIPPRASKHPPHDIAEPFTAGVLGVLAKSAVATYFRGKIDAGALAREAQAAAQAGQVRDRFLLAAALMGQVFDPHAIVLSDQLSLLMHDWTVFEKDHPLEAAELKPLRDWWEAHHVGGRPATKAPTPAAPA